MTPRRQSVRLAIYIVGGLMFLWFAQRATGQVGSWRDMPPARYWEPVTVMVTYQPRDVIQRVCGTAAIACYTMGTIYMPGQCGTGTGRETIDVGHLVRFVFSFCGSTKAHEGGHANGWPGYHPA